MGRSLQVRNEEMAPSCVRESEVKIRAEMYLLLTGLGACFQTARNVHADSALAVTVGRTRAGALGGVGRLSGLRRLRWDLRVDFGFGLSLSRCWDGLFVQRSSRRSSCVGLLCGSLLCRSDDDGPDLG